MAPLVLKALSYIVDCVRPPWAKIRSEKLKYLRKYKDLRLDFFTVISPNICLYCVKFSDESIK